MHYRKRLLCMGEILCKNAIERTALSARNSNRMKVIPKADKNTKTRINMRNARTTANELEEEEEKKAAQKE